MQGKEMQGKERETKEMQTQHTNRVNNLTNKQTNKQTRKQTNKRAARLLVCVQRDYQNKPNQTKPKLRKLKSNKWNTVWEKPEN